ncbi:response regulator receiver protein [Candidatus Magnetoovum chiemensis]|nr:response regulator receiver protein [Candidatus Magnetoovum chiemensis]
MDKRRLLIVDKVLENRNFIKEGLYKCCAHIEVHEAVGSGNAKDMMNDFKYDIVINRWDNDTDEGIELLKWIRANRIQDKKISVIVITEADNSRTSADAFQCGADVIIVEPFSIDKLVQQIMILSEKFDRRKTTRFNASNPVLLKFNANYAEGKLLDISSGGLYGVFIIEDAMPQLLQNVIVNIEYEGEPIVFELNGVILRLEVSDIITSSTSIKISIRFIDVTEVQEQMLSGYLVSLKKCAAP